METTPSFREQGLSALRQGDATAAARFLSDAVRMDANDAEVWSALGVALCKLRQMPEGLAALQRAVELRPSAAPLHFNLGWALELRGQPVEALASFRRTLELHPAHAGATDGIRRLEAPAPAVAAPTLGDFMLASDRPAMASLPAVAPVPPAAFAPVVKAPATTWLPSSGSQAPPLAGYGRPAPMTYGGARQQAGAPQAHRSGMSPWAIVGIVFLVLLVAGGGVVMVLAGLFLPAVQRAREAAVRAERRQQERAWPGRPGGTSPVPGYIPRTSTPTFGTAPQFRPSPIPDLPRTRIAEPRLRQYEMPTPRMRQYQIPEPPRFTPPPIPEPPHFTPPDMPMPRSPRMFGPRSFPGGGGPRFRYGPPGAEMPTPTEPSGTPVPGTTDVAPAPGN
jgi:hypothetical protein